MYSMKLKSLLQMKKIILLAITCMIGYYASADCGLGECPGDETKCCSKFNGDTYYKGASTVEW